MCLIIFLSWSAFIPNKLNGYTKPPASLFELTEHPNPEEQFKNRRSPYSSFIDRLMRYEDSFRSVIQEYFLDFQNKNQQMIDCLKKNREKKEEEKFNIYYSAIVNFLKMDGSTTSSRKFREVDEKYSEKDIEEKEFSLNKTTNRSSFDFSSYLKSVPWDDLHLVETYQADFIDRIMHHDNDSKSSDPFLFEYSNKFQNFGPLEVEENKSKVITLSMNNFIPGNIYRCILYCNFPYPYILFTSTKHLYIDYTFEKKHDSSREDFKNNLIAFIIAIPMYFESLDTISFSDIKVWEKAEEVLNRIKGIEENNSDIESSLREKLMTIGNFYKKSDEYIEVKNKNNIIKIMPYTPYENIEFSHNFYYKNTENYNENGDLIKW